MTVEAGAMVFVNVVPGEEPCGFGKGTARLNKKILSIHRCNPTNVNQKARSRDLEFQQCI